MRFEAELPDTEFDALVAESIKWHYDNMGEEQKVPFYSDDPEEEGKKVKKMRKALKTVYNLFSVPSKQIE